MNHNEASSPPLSQYLEQWQSTSIGADVSQSYCITDVVIECTLEYTDADYPAPTKMEIEIFSPEITTGEALILEKISSLKWRHKNGVIKVIDEVTFIATWDETGSFGFVHLTKNEIEKFIPSASSHNEAKQEFMIETDDLVFKLILRFKICQIPSDENVKKVQQIEKDLQYGSPMSEEPEKMFRMVLELPDNVPEKLRFLDTYGIFFTMRSNSNSDTNNSILAYDSAVHLTPEDHEDMPSRLHALGVLLGCRFEKTGDLSDISKAISSLQKAIRLTPPGHADMPSRLNMLGVSFRYRFDDTSDLTDISQAISFQQKAVHLTPQGHADMPTHLGNLGHSFRRRFEHTTDVTDISQAISSLQKTVHLTPQGHADLPHRLSNLGNCFVRRFECTGDLVDLSEALSYHRKAVNLTPQGHSVMPSHLNHLGVSLSYRFKRTGDLTDIAEAISSQQKAVHLCPPGHVDMPSHLNNLGNSFAYRFQRTGDLTDISQSISSHQKAVHLCPQGHADVPTLLNHLGVAFQRRFERTGDLADLSEAISSLQTAVNLTPQGHADMPRYLNNLGNLFIHRFESTGELTDISKAVVSHQRAVDLTPQIHASMPLRLSNLGNSFRRRFKCTGNLIDISEAISSQKKAVQLTPQEHADMHSHLNHLGNSLMNRFDRTGDPFDLSEAILFQEKAVRLTPQGHAEMPGQLINLGHSFQRRFECAGDLTDIHTAVSRFSLAATYSSGPPSIRFEAAILWATWSQKISPFQSLDAYHTAIQLVSQVAGLEQTIQKRHINLFNISRLAASAAAYAFKVSKPELALEWLEQGRCLVWSQLNNLRTPLAELFAHDEALANDMLRVSRALEKSGSRGELTISSGEASMEQKISLQDEATVHVKLAQEWNQLLTNIRAIPDFKDFLQPPSCSNLLKHLPDSGPVVVINVHEDTCDALALVSGLDEPIHIPLPNFSYAKANGLRKQLNTRLRSANLRMRGCEIDDAAIRKGRPVENTSSGGAKPGEILCQLWSLVVKPILDGLGFSAEPVSNLPRIWWCATGPLAFLPIHAAGVYATSTTKAGSTLSDFAVSSYIPTVRALSERIKGPRAVNEKMGLFMVSQPETPNMTRIPGTTREVRAIKNLLEHHNLRVLCLESEAATIKEGLTNMETHSCIHFACHASQNTLEPLKSRFILQDGSLELSAVIKLNLVGADLAYLSACQTSTGDEKLSEEAVHLAAGMLAAGYRGVVATMWSISDHHGPQIAEDFYASLITQGEKSEGLSTLSSDNAARALHYATQKLRKKLGDEASSLLLWIPYVYFGL